MNTVGNYSIATDQDKALGSASYGYVVVQIPHYPVVAQIKAADPAARVLAYMGAPTVHRFAAAPAAVPTVRTPLDTMGLSYDWADKCAPGWFLLDRNGQRLVYADYPASYVMDVGHRDYKAWWLRTVLAEVMAAGFDGVWLDDVNIHPGHGLAGRIGKYMDAQYGAAMVGFVKAVCAEFHRHNKLVVANLAATPWVPWELDLAMQAAAVLDGVNREHWCRYGDIAGPWGELFNDTPGNGTPPVPALLDYAQRLQAAGAGLFGVDYGSTVDTSADVAAMRYGRALWLMCWDGKTPGAYMYRRNGAVDPWSPDWTLEPGAPLGPTVVAGTTLTRQFENGLLVLNFSRTESLSVSGTVLPPTSAALL